MSQGSDKAAASAAAWRHWLEKNFYLAMAWFIVVVVIWGFSYTVGPRLLHPKLRPPAIIYVHGAVFFCWCVLLIVQTRLVQQRRVAQHRRLGPYFAVLGAGLPVIGLVTTWIMYHFEIGRLGYAVADKVGFLPFPLLDMLAFACTFALAVRWRTKPEYHRRLMLIAAATLTAAAWGRLPVDIPVIDASYAGVDLLLLLGALRDLLLLRRVHVVYLWALASMVPLQLAAVYIDRHHPAWWMPIGQTLLGV